jgi:hypothetical protein
VTFVEKSERTQYRGHKGAAEPTGITLKNEAGLTLSLFRQESGDLCLQVRVPVDGVYDNQYLYGSVSLEKDEIEPFLKSINAMKWRE